MSHLGGKLRLKHLPGMRAPSILDIDLETERIEGHPESNDWIREYICHDFVTLLGSSGQGIGHRGALKDKSSNESFLVMGDDKVRSWSGELRGSRHGEDFCVPFIDA